MIYPISKTEYDQALANQSYYAARWPYYEEAIDQVMRYRPSSILELGCMTLPLFRNSHTMDVSTGCNPTILHDASKTPWPVSDKAYDMFMSLQVWEHLASSQADAFREVKRVSHRAVISFPLMWGTKDPTNIHSAISMDKIAEWTLNTAPEKVIIMPPWHIKRAIYVFDFTA